MFGAIEHVGVYPAGDGGSAGTAEWYNKVFGWPVTKAGSTGFFANQGKFGWIEAMAAPQGESCHIAVYVKDFDGAVADLKARGFELEETKTAPTYKLAYLKQRDPGGNLVHIVWRI
ncbi:MAG TPA: VOC family protein [Chloroflexota bacterium]|nr:VOC family protein [Chloroflexota bacterium]